MNNLPFLPVMLELSRNESLFPERKELACIAVRIAEIGERQDIALAVHGKDPKRAARPALPIFRWRDFDADHAPIRRIVKPEDPLPMDQPGWQMKQ